MGRELLAETVTRKAGFFAPRQLLLHCPTTVHPWTYAKPALPPSVAVGCGCEPHGWVQGLPRGWLFQIQVYLGEILPDQVSVELYAEGIDDEKPQVIESDCKEKMAGAIHGYTYVANIETTRPATNFTARIIPQHTEAQIPAEASLISWQH